MERHRVHGSFQPPAREQRQCLGRSELSTSRREKPRSCRSVSCLHGRTAGEIAHSDPRRRRVSRCGTALARRKSVKSAERGSHWVVYAALAANVGICIAKFTAALLSGSASLLSEGIHSLADSGNELLLLLGLRLSRRAPDRSHPYGYGKEQYFWSLIVALVLFAGGGGTSIYEGVRRLLHPHAVEH